MGRKLFLSHLAEASLTIVANIQDVDSPEEGIITCTYVYPQNQAQQVTIQLCATDLDEYPDGNSFMLYTDDDVPDPVIPETLQQLTEHAHGKVLNAILSKISERLTAAILGEAAESGPGDDENEDDAFDFDFEGDSDVEHFGLDDIRFKHAGYTCDNVDTSALSSQTPATVEKLRADLKALKEAGFRVGVFGNLLSSGVLCISVRVAKLGLSDEAMQAWKVQRKQYLVFMMRYTQGYRDALKLTTEIDQGHSVEMRVGLCDHYKPSLRHVPLLFQHSNTDTLAPKDSISASVEDDHPFKPVFIGKPLDQLLENRLLKVIQARHRHGLSWLGAEMFIDWRQASASTMPVDDMDQYACDDDAKASNLPAIVTADHLRHTPLGKASLPLIAMQFVLRHFVRCTEFCLVCHCRVDNSLEALKPYVCSKPLCLYQYMALGFGPSLEWEIVSQPYVVDLLVSFCYAAARGLSLKERPVGMNLIVPVVPNVQTFIKSSGALFQPAFAQAKHHTPMPPAAKSFTCKWNLGMQYLSVETEEEASNPQIKTVKPGAWLVLLCEQNHTAAHCRVTGVDLPRILLGEPIFVPFGETSSNQAHTDSIGKTGATNSLFQADCYLYDKSFDDLHEVHQQQAILILLDALPSIREMCENLKGQGKGRDYSLRAWSERISESSLNLLRWIVASNRSCIVLVGDIVGGDTSETVGPAEDRVGEMGSWIQFRFAQGAPDKEKRFNDCVQEEAKVTGTNYPTLFAFHGSRLANWHSIVRQGLRYDGIVHGRAYGHGVYMSPNASTSLGYTESPLETSVNEWIPSMLKVRKAFSLNEVVNRPEKFVSSNPHYVVSNLDWIQTRYLFVMSKAAPVDNPSLGTVYAQDPVRVACNEAHYPISIPITAISKSRRPCHGVQTAQTAQGKRTKTMCDTDQATVERQEDDADSILSDASDLALHQDLVEHCVIPIRESGVSSLSESQAGKKRCAEAAANTDFVPGKLDSSGIKFMEAPKDATTASTKALMRLLQEALGVQDKTPPATLGWYVDRNVITNLYQWIVELHSFPKELPLARDMKAAGMTSIVLEIRFTSQFPFSPPFIRVVKPRFLPFSRGGGGNVTEGGAMCMEVLTNNGWSAGLTIESLLLQVRLVIADEERPARLTPRDSSTPWTEAYSIGEAKEAYVRACRTHGWTVPAGFYTIQ